MAILVSVVIPCFNGADSILRAIGSLQNQTHTNWEAIVVNDGSTDQTRNIVLGVKDSRIKYFEFEKNKGRGAARQKGLEEASGQYLAMIDADDWIYSTKLEDQLKILESNLELALVSGGMAITDGVSNLKGMRLGTNKVETWKDVGFPPIPHGPSMIRMNLAKPHKYDITMKYSQDIDFLSRCMLGKKYLVSNRIWYVYSEHQSVTKSKILFSYFFSLKYISRFFFKRPIVVLKHVIILLLKIAYISVISLFTSIEDILNRRSVEPTFDVIEEFEEEKNRLEIFLKL